MTFEHIRFGRVVQAIIIILIVSFGFQILLSFCYGITRVMEAFSDLDPDATQEEQEERLREEIDKIFDEAAEGSSTLNNLSIIQWAITAAVTAGIAYRTARRNAISPAQGTGYGVAIGAGTLLVYLLCILGATVGIPVKLVFMLLIFGAGVFGGQFGGQNPSPEAVRASDTPPGRMPSGLPGSLPPGQLSGAPSGENPETYYNMGVSAAMGGRREEARRHFTRVIQLQPRNVAAWLQLANLADTPAQAWEYVQQARTISPHDPAVQQAVDIIWPKVQADQAAQKPPTLQPPYKGGASDDAAIPRSTLPGVPGAAPGDGEPKPPEST